MRELISVSFCELNLPLCFLNNPVQKPLDRAEQGRCSLSVHGGWAWWEQRKDA